MDLEEFRAVVGKKQENCCTVPDKKVDTRSLHDRMIAAKMDEEVLDGVVIVKGEVTDDSEYEDDDEDDSGADLECSLSNALSLLEDTKQLLDNLLTHRNTRKKLSTYYTIEVERLTEEISVFLSEYIDVDIIIRGSRKEVIDDAVIEQMSPAMQDAVAVFSKEIPEVSEDAVIYD